MQKADNHAGTGSLYDRPVMQIIAILTTGYAFVPELAIVNIADELRLSIP